MKVLKITVPELPLSDPYYIAEGGEDMLMEAGINMLEDDTSYSTNKFLVELIEVTEAQWNDIGPENKSPEDFSGRSRRT